MQVCINTEVPNERLLGGFEGMLPREHVDFPDLHVLRCFEAHKLDDNIGLKPSRWAVA